MKKYFVLLLITFILSFLFKGSFLAFGTFLVGIAALIAKRKEFAKNILILFSIFVTLTMGFSVISGMLGFITYGSLVYRYCPGDGSYPPIQGQLIPKKEMNKNYLTFFINKSLANNFIQSGQRYCPEDKLKINTTNMLLFSVFAILLHSLFYILLRPDKLGLIWFLFFLPIILFLGLSFGFSAYESWKEKNDPCNNYPYYLCGFE